MPQMRSISLVVLGALLSLSAIASAQQRKPNVVMIVADDLGYADVGCHNLSKDVKTPHIDSIAAGGVRFTNGYVSGPVCSPTRAGLLTGRYQQRFGFEQNPQKGEHERFGLPLDQITLPQVLKKAGYATGMVGKWHLGHHKGMLPHERGFDEFFGFAGGAHRYINNEIPQKDNNAIQRNGKPVGESEYLTDAFTREAVDFVERHKDEPFFLYLPYNAPHTPLQAPEKYLSRFADVKDQKRRSFLAMLSAVDDGVGQLLDTLREHKLEANTLVIFFSDNGGPTPGNTSRNEPLRGTKGETFEGGIRVPFMMQWKGRIPAGKVDDRTVVQLDLFPTILALAGAEQPQGVTTDGKDLLPYLAEGNTKTVHETLYWRFGPRRAIRAGNWKLQWNGNEKPGLYDLSKDISESHNLAAEHPEVVERLMADWKKWDATLVEPLWPGRLEGGPKKADAEDNEGKTKPAKRRKQ